MKKDTNQSLVSRQPGSRESGLFAPAAEGRESLSGTEGMAPSDEETTDLEALGQLPGEEEEGELDQLQEGELDEEDEDIDEDEDEYDEEDEDEDEDELEETEAEK